MGWGRTLLLGDFGTQMNVSDLENEIEQIRAYLRAQQSTHGSADAWIQSLQQENHELKAYLAALIRLLVAKKILSQDEVARFVALLDPGTAT